MAEVIFTTIHGSHLYGMATPMSDADTFTVTTTDRRRALNRVRGNDDQTIMGLDTFLEYAYTGSHQAVEALFSPFKVWHSHGYLRPMIESMRIGGPDVLTKYRRTVTKFAHADDFKRRRHACRLWLNLQSLRTDGHFNPRMTPEEIHWATDVATSDTDREQLYLLLQEGSSALGNFLRDEPEPNPR